MVKIGVLEAEAEWAAEFEMASQEEENAFFVRDSTEPEGISCTKRRS